jgi:hypothetical protein
MPLKCKLCHFFLNKIDMYMSNIIILDIWKPVVKFISEKISKTRSVNILLGPLFDDNHDSLPDDNIYIRLVLFCFVYYMESKQTHFCIASYTIIGTFYVLFRSSKYTIVGTLNVYSRVYFFLSVTKVFRVISLSC